MNEALSNHVRDALVRIEERERSGPTGSSERTVRSPEGLNQLADRLATEVLGGYNAEMGEISTTDFSPILRAVIASWEPDAWRQLDECILARHGARIQFATIEVPADSAAKKRVIQGLVALQQLESVIIVMPQSNKPSVHLVDLRPLTSIPGLICIQGLPNVTVACMAATKSNVLCRGISGDSKITKLDPPREMVPADGLSHALSSGLRRLKIDSAAPGPESKTASPDPSVPLSISFRKDFRAPYRSGHRPVAYLGARHFGSAVEIHVREMIDLAKQLRLPLSRNEFLLELGNELLPVDIDVQTSPLAYRVTVLDSINGQLRKHVKTEQDPGVLGQMQLKDWLPPEILQGRAALVHGSLAGTLWHKSGREGAPRLFFGREDAALAMVRLSMDANDPQVLGAHLASPCHEAVQELSKGAHACIGGPLFTLRDAFWRAACVGNTGSAVAYVKHVLDDKSTSGAAKAALLHGNELDADDRSGIEVASAICSAFDRGFGKTALAIAEQIAHAPPGTFSGREKAELLGMRDTSGSLLHRLCDSKRAEKLNDPGYESLGAYLAFLLESPGTGVDLSQAVCTVAHAGKIAGAMALENKNWVAAGSMACSVIQAQAKGALSRPDAEGLLRDMQIGKLKTLVKRLKDLPIGAAKAKATQYRRTIEGYLQTASARSAPSAQSASGAPLSLLEEPAGGLLDSKAISGALPVGEAAQPLAALPKALPAAEAAQAGPALGREERVRRAELTRMVPASLSAESKKMESSAADAKEAGASSADAPSIHSIRLFVTQANSFDPIHGRSTLIHESDKGDIFVPSKRRYPHLHIGSDFVTWSKANGRHLNLIESGSRRSDTRMRQVLQESRSVAVSQVVQFMQPAPDQETPGQRIRKAGAKVEFSATALQKHALGEDANVSLNLIVVRAESPSVVVCRADRVIPALHAGAVSSSELAASGAFFYYKIPVADLK